MKKYLGLILLLVFCYTGCGNNAELKYSEPEKIIAEPIELESRSMEIPVMDELLENETLFEGTQSEVEVSLNDKQYEDSNSMIPEENSIPVVDKSSADQINEAKASENGNISLDIYMKIESDIQSLVNDNIYTVEVAVVNNSSETLDAGNDYKIQQYKDNAWSDVPVNFAWNDSGISISPNSEKSFTISLGSDQHTYQNGTYRILKTVYVNRTAYNLTAKFEIQ